MNVYGTSETSEQEVCTLMPTVSNTANPLPPRPRKNRSEAWDHFTVEPGEEKKAKCYYCGTIIKCDNGTSAMTAHWRRCQNIPTEGANKRQKSGSSSTANMEGSSIISKFDQVELRKALVKMFIALELPFRKVLTMTVDNASSNDVGILYLKKYLMPDLVMEGKYFHTRCCAHVLNLIVKDGLKKTLIIQF
ncbi:hypothetical protein TSUD_98550 [Trifolium subterraneum]|uniref:BED-type domain-containing protein n=1 Tax=Trifolium subterraneum TaxID=3900 RepID=A0A2Z6P5V6_TRISU|nr:hypothetical protein TSUD_98550 [Trifolium subterraneum]